MKIEFSKMSQYLLWILKRTMYLCFDHSLNKSSYGAPIYRLLSFECYGSFGEKFYQTFSTLALLFLTTNRAPKSLKYQEDIKVLSQEVQAQNISWKPCKRWSRVWLGSDFGKIHENLQKKWKHNTNSSRTALWSWNQKRILREIKSKTSKTCHFDNWVLKLTHSWAEKLSEWHEICFT